jgi:transposase-like protein
VQVNIKNLVDDVQCYQTVRELRWPDGVACSSCESKHGIKRGLDDTEPARQRYACHDCGQRFDDGTDPIFAGHHQPLKVWILCLYFMGLNVSNEQMAHEWSVDESEVYHMTAQLRDGIVKKSPQCPCPTRWSATKPMSQPAIRGSLQW